MENNRAVLYLRLSKEDVDKVDKGDDSASIRNQRLMLTDYALNRGFKIVKVYSDDDESGLYDNRPGFEEMMIDAKLGFFDVIIAKTQARFSRNMEHVEKYLHHDLPNLGIRFIGAVDGTDTYNSANKKSRQINGLVNEWYCEDLSANIRSAYKAKMRNGDYMGSSCPYGYIKDPNNHNHLIVDEYAAGIVRRIFSLYLQGVGKQRIGKILTLDGVLIPTIYKRKILGLNYHNAKEKDNSGIWSYQTIHNILNNQTYLGNLEQNRTNTLSYKDKKKRLLPKSEWIVVNDTHEPIIDKETFLRVKELQKVKTKSVDAQKVDGMFSGIIFCADCGCAMNRQYNRHGKHEIVGYVCKTYKTKGKCFCPSHSIKNMDLETSVLFYIKEQARQILNPDDIDELKKLKVINHTKGLVQNELKTVENLINKNKTYKSRTYENLMEGIISKEEYANYTAQYDKELKNLINRRDEILTTINIQESLDCQYDEWVENFKDYINVDKLTREMVVELIEKVMVNEDGTIDITYRFSNPYQECLL